MRRKLSAALTLSALTFSLAATISHAQDTQSDQKAIEDFINSRGVEFTAPPPRPKSRWSPPAPGARPARKPPAQETSPKAPDVADGAKPNSPAPPKREAKESGGDNKAAPESRPAVARRIGLGHTLLMEEDGKPVVVDESREFKVGDKIRILLEPNSNGYLYIFGAQGGKQIRMLYPHAALDGGWNGIGAHMREYVPAEGWFEFDPPPGTVRIHVIFSREPLEGVPTGDELLEVCGGPREECYWEPKLSEWKRIQVASQTEAVEAKNSQLAGAQASLPDDTLTRGLRLKKESSAPAVVRLNPSTSAGVLMTVITLAYK